MEFGRVLKELLLVVLFSVFFLIFTIFMSFILLSMFIQDCLIFISKGVGDLLWQTKK